MFIFPELMDFKTRRVIAFRKHLIELAELEVKHAKVSFHDVKNILLFLLALVLLVRILYPVFYVWLSHKCNTSRIVSPV